MSKIRFYDDSELIGLNPEQLAHLRLVSRVLDLDDFADADAAQLEQMTDDHLREILGDSEKIEQQERNAPKPRKPKASKKAAPAQQIKPRTIEEAFALVNGQLMRRRVAIVEVVQKDNTRYMRQVERLTVCNDRVRFGDRVLLSKVVAHYLKTGEMLDRAPRDKPAPRYKAQARNGARVVHLGYFATREEREAAVFAYKLGIREST